MKIVLGAGGKVADRDGLPLFSPLTSVSGAFQFAPIHLTNETMMRVLACQLDIAWEDKGANYDRARRMLASAAPPAGSLVVLAEMFATGFSMRVAQIGEPPAGRNARFSARNRRRVAQCFLLAGLVTLQADGRGRNEAVLIDPSGAETARYCKRHPFSLAHEPRHFAAGGEAVVVAPVGPFQMAPSICYDLRFPEDYRRATAAGANLLAVIANWPEARVAHWRALLVARAIENQAYVIGVNRVGTDPEAKLYGPESDRRSLGTTAGRRPGRGVRDRGRFRPRYAAGISADLAGAGRYSEGGFGRVARFEVKPPIHLEAGF